MRNLLRCFGMSVLILASGFQVAFPQNQAPGSYQALLTRLKQGDRTVDFVEIRRAYAESPECNGGSDVLERTAMFNALDRRDFAQVLEHSKKILEKHYLNIDAHQAAFVANRELHIQAEADFHHFVAQGLVSAIFHSGHCMSRETACEVLSVHEIETVFQVLGLNWDTASDSRVDSGTHSYEVFNVVNPKTKNKITLYFNNDWLDVCMKRSTNVLD